MNSVDLLGQRLIVDWPCRVCLPYGVDLLQLARWVNASNETLRSPQFEIVVGEASDEWHGSDAIQLFSEIQKKCINYSLAHSYVVCKQPRSMMFFDMYGRFSFFAADFGLLNNLYPFSPEIMWENFLLLQEEDGDLQLAEVFHAVQSPVSARP